jgi:hypothetical protein
MPAMLTKRTGLTILTESGQQAGHKLEVRVTGGERNIPKRLRTDDLDNEPQATVSTANNSPGPRIGAEAFLARGQHPKPGSRLHDLLLKDSSQVQGKSSQLLCRHIPESGQRSGESEEAATQ